MQLQLVHALCAKKPEVQLAAAHQQRQQRRRSLPAGRTSVRPRALSSSVVDFCGAAVLATATFKALEGAEQLALKRRGLQERAQAPAEPGCPPSQHLLEARIDALENAVAMLQEADKMDKALRSSSHEETGAPGDE